MSEKLTIVLAEDEIAVATYMKLTLVKAGYNVIHAPNGADAVDLVGRHRPDLVLMDVEMPELDGRQACRILKGDKTTQDIPVIFLTGMDSPENIVAGLRAGGDDYVPKPPINSVLLARIAAQLRIRSLHQENLQFIEALHEVRRERDMAILLSGISHNYNNLLAPLVSLAPLLQKSAEIGDMEEVRDIAGDLEGQLSKLKSFNDKVGLVRQAPQSGDKFAPVQQVLEPVAELFACSLPLRVTFQLNMNPVAGKAQISAGRLDDALLALLMNAREAVEKKDGAGEIQLKVTLGRDLGEELVCVSVTDNGGGLRAEELEKAFLPFYSTKSTVASGLGLPLARKIVTEVGGTLQLSNRPEVGAEALVTLPVHFPETTQPGE